MIFKTLAQGGGTGEDSTSGNVGLATEAGGLFTFFFFSEELETMENTL